MEAAYLYRKDLNLLGHDGVVENGRGRRRNGLSWYEKVFVI